MTAQLDLALPGARRVACRVCAGACEIPHSSGLWRVPCPFCDEGIAKKVCDACGEALPLCPCFGECRGVVTKKEAAEAPRKGRTG